MDMHGFITTVERVGDIHGDQEAERVACVTLEALSRRISRGEARDLAARLPEGLRSCIRPVDRQETFHLDEFLRRIAEPLGLDRSVAEREARAVLAAVFRAVGPDEFADMRSELPKDFGPLLDEAVATAEPDERSPTTMTYDEFLSRVEERTGLQRTEASRAVEAVLETLAYRLTGRAVDQLEQVLPHEVWPALERGRRRSGGKPVAFGVEEFVRKVADESGLDHAAAERAVAGVLAVLFTVSGPDGFLELRSELPKDFGPLLDRAAVEAAAPRTAPAERAPTMSYEAFLAEIAMRGARERDIARKAAEAVLEVLAMRITGGQLDDIVPWLPRELRPALERGRARGGGRAHPLSLEEFLRQVQRLEGVTRDIAFQHARAVFLTLRQAIGEKEFHDTMAQLPAEFHQLLRTE